MCWHRSFIGALLATSAAVMPVTSFSSCDVHSGPKTAALIELYTSEGCSSCPPADRMLSQLRQTLGPAAEVVPLALHVDYWDYIGWKDPYAHRAFGERQSWLVNANRQKTVYTPQFFVGGTELRSWRAKLSEQVRRLNALPAGAAIRVQAGSAVSGTLALSAEAKTPAASLPAALYLVITESGLTSQVMRGENSGVTLTHEHVVRAWIGPIRLTDGAARVQRSIELPAEWSRARLDIIAFVQADSSGRVLQALRAQHCAVS